MPLRNEQDAGISLISERMKIATLLAINISPLRGWLSGVSIRSISQTSANVFFGEFGIITNNFFVSHSRSQPTEHVRNSNPHPTNCRATAALAGFDGDDVLVVHLATYSTLTL